MNSLRYAACALVLGFVAPVWAINKCTDAQGKVSFQDAPCEGQGEKIEVRPSIQGATPIKPDPSTGKGGVFGTAWQRKHYLQSQGIPQARAAIGRHQKECEAQSETVAHAGPLRRSTLASGSQFVQERAASAAKNKVACEGRAQELRDQLRALESEYRGL